MGSREQASELVLYMSIYIEGAQETYTFFRIIIFELMQCIRPKRLCDKIAVLAKAYT
jgi:hypothetical protein